MAGGGAPLRHPRGWCRDFNDGAPAAVPGALCCQRVSQRPLACTRSGLRGPQVRWEHARPFPSKAEGCAAEHELLFPHGPAIGYGWMAQDLNEAGAVGDASDADAERGATVVAHYGDALAKLLEEVGGVDADTLLKKLTARSGGT